MFSEKFKMFEDLHNQIKIFVKNLSEEVRKGRRGMRVKKTPISVLAFLGREKLIALSYVYL